MSETYVCPHCGEPAERSYAVRLVITTCPECGEHGNFLHRSIHALLAAIPKGERPDGWGKMDPEQRVLAALREGIIDIDDVTVA